MDWRARAIGLRVGGHRGSSRLAPENTFAAFEQALTDRAAYVETDIRRTSDGALVVMHDASVDRTTDGHGDVASLTLDEIRALDAGAWFSTDFRSQRVPEFVSFMAWVEGHPPMGAALEIKAAATGREVAELAWASPARDRVAIYSFLPDEIRAAKAVRPELPCVLLLRLTDAPGSVMAWIEACGADGADVPWQWDARQLIDEMRSRGMIVGGGSADGGQAAAELVDQGVDMIDTDDPAAMYDAVRGLS
jgi:glycerophosphoryl diester phosphodiesterase